MKKLALLFMMFALLCAKSNSQSIDLANLAEGRLVAFGPIFPDDPTDLCAVCVDKEYNLYGYYQIVDKGEVSSGVSKFEYTLFDVNLNPYANNEFEDLNFGKIDEFKILSQNDQFKLYREQHAKNIKIFYFRDLDDRNNTLSKPYFINLNNRLESDYFEITNRNKILRLIRKHFKETIDNEDIIQEYFFDGSSLSLTRNLKKWEHSIRYIKKDSIIIDTKYDFEDYKSFILILNIDAENEIALIYKHDNKSKGSKRNLINASFISIKISTGEVIKEIPYEDVFRTKKNKIIHTTPIRSYNNQLFHINNITRSGFNFNIMDISDLNNLTINSKTFEYKDLSFVEVEKYNIIDNGVQRRHHINVVDYYFKENGNILVLFQENRERFDPGNDNKKNNIILSNLFNYHLAEYDKDFNYIKSNELVKEDLGKFGKLRDYSSHIYTKDGVILVTLVINQTFPVKGLTEITKNYEEVIFYKYNEATGEINSSVLPLKKEGSEISVMVAKQGYILIREYSKEDKIDEIRLEKLAF